MARLCEFSICINVRINMYVNMFMCMVTEVVVNWLYSLSHYTNPPLTLWHQNKLSVFVCWVLPVLLDVVKGPERLPADEESQEMLRGKLRILQSDITEVEALLTVKLMTHSHSYTQTNIASLLPWWPGFQIQVPKRCSTKITCSLWVSSYSGSNNSGDDSWFL